MLDPGSLLLAASAALGTGALEEAGRRAMCGTLDFVKGMLRSKFGEDSPQVKTLAELERTDPDSPERADVVRRVNDLNLQADPALNAALEQLRRLVDAMPAKTTIAKNVFHNNTFTNTTFF